MHASARLCAHGRQTQGSCGRAADIEEHAARIAAWKQAAVARPQPARILGAGPINPYRTDPSPYPHLTKKMAELKATQFSKNECLDGMPPLKG